MKEIFVLGDIELGAGTITDDFISDRALARVIRKAAKVKGKVDLVLNGDTFDFLKIPGQNELGRITESVSLRKIKQIHAAHPQIFKSLSDFGTRAGKNIFFTYGNHDQDLAFPKVRAYLKKVLGHAEFPGTFYQSGSVYVEHGHRHDLLNASDEPFSWHRTERVLRVPFASSLVMGSFLDLKQEHPFLERIHSQRMLARLYPELAGKISKRAWSHVWHLAKTALGDRSHPVVNVPRGIVSELYRRWKEQDWGVPDASKAVDLAHLPLISIFGHKHITKVMEGKSTIILPDTWRDEYLLSWDGMLRAKRKQYVRVKVKGKGVSWKLVHVPIRRSVWRFKDVIRDEQKFIDRAAKEEGRVTSFAKNPV